MWSLVEALERFEVGVKTFFSFSFLQQKILVFWQNYFFLKNSCTTTLYLFDLFGFIHCKNLDYKTIISSFKENTNLPYHSCDTSVKLVTITFPCFLEFITSPHIVTLEQSLSSLKQTNPIFLCHQSKLNLENLEDYQYWSFTHSKCKLLCAAKTLARILYNCKNYK